MTIEHGTKVRTQTDVEGVVIASGRDQVLVKPDGGTAHDAEWHPNDQIEVIHV